MKKNNLDKIKLKLKKFILDHKSVFIFFITTYILIMICLELFLIFSSYSISRYFLYPIITPLIWLHIIPLTTIFYLIKKTNKNSSIWSSLFKLVISIFFVWIIMCLYFISLWSSDAIFGLMIYSFELIFASLILLILTVIILKIKKHFFS